MDENFINKTKKELTKIQHYMKDISNQYNLLKSKIEGLLNFPSELSKKINDKIDSFLNWFNDIEKSQKDQNSKEFDEYYNNLKKELKEYYNKIMPLYNNKFITKIIELNENIQKLIDKIILFEPPEQNNYSDYSDSTIKVAQELEEESNPFYENINKSSFYENSNIISFARVQNENIIKCYFDKENEGVYYCNHCCNIFCEVCKKKIESNKNVNNHVLKEIDEIRREKEEEKNKFLNSFIDIIKENILKCDFILTNKKDNFLNEYIIKRFQFPLIKNITDFNSQKEFLNEINDINKSLTGTIYSTNSSKNESKLKDKLLINFLINTMKNLIDNDIDLEEKIENEYDFVEEKFTKGQNDEEYEENENIFEDIKNKFWYIIYLINKENYYYFDKNKLREEIIENLNESIDIDKNNIFILYNNKRAFIDFFIKTQQFVKLSPKALRTNYPNLKLLYEYKLIIDCFFRLKCKIPIESFNFKYNFITPNLRLNRRRGSEIYNPPYGWLGIGLNVTKKYENEDWLNKIDGSSKWAIGYYFFEKNLTNEEMICKLNKIIIKNEINIDENFQVKMDIFNRRLNDTKMQRVGKGFYLCPDINLAEKYTGCISFNKKRYKIVLMAKVLIESIREPDDGSFWIIPKKEYFRIYRILLKEII